MQEDKNLFNNVPLEQREEMLLGMATKTETEKVKRHYSDDEKSQIREFATEESIQLMDKEEAFSEVKKAHNTEVKAHNKEIIKALKDVKRGFSESEEKVYLIADHENGTMDVHDKFGEFLYSRKLFPDERQTTILEMKSGTHD